MADDADREITQGRKDSRDGPGSDLGTVRVEGVVLNRVQALDRPVASFQAEEMLDEGVLVPEVAHVESGLDPDPEETTQQVELIEHAGLQLRFTIGRPTHSGPRPAYVEHVSAPRAGLRPQGGSC